MWGYAKNSGCTDDRTIGFDSRKVAIDAAKKMLKADGIPGRHIFYSFEVFENFENLKKNEIDEIQESNKVDTVDSVSTTINEECEVSEKTIQKNQYILNVADIVESKESLEELYNQVKLSSNDIALEKKLFIKIASMMQNYKIRFSEIRADMQLARKHLVVRDTFTIDGYHRKRGDHLCHGKYVGSGYICHNCTQELIKLDKIIESDIPIKWKTKKTILIIDNNNDNISLIKDVFRDKELILSISRARSIDESRTRAQVLMPDITLMNINIDNAEFLAKELRLNDLEVILYGDRTHADFDNEGLFLTIPLTICEHRVFCDKILEKYNA